MQIICEVIPGSKSKRTERVRGGGGKPIRGVLPDYHWGPWDLVQGP